MTRKPTSNDSSVPKTAGSALSAAEISSALKKEQNAIDKIQKFTIVKRNGSIVPFRRERISHAVEAAFRDTKKVPKETALDAELKKTTEQITDLVISELVILASRGASLTV